MIQGRLYSCADFADESTNFSADFRAILGADAAADTFSFIASTGDASLMLRRRYLHGAAKIGWRRIQVFCDQTTAGGWQLLLTHFDPITQYSDR